MAKPKRAAPGATPPPGTTAPGASSRPHAGVDRRRKDMRGKKYTGTPQIGTKY